MKLRRIIDNCLDNPFLTGDALKTELVGMIEKHFELIDRSSISGIQKQVMDYFNFVKFRYMRIPMNKKNELKLSPSRKRMISARAKEGYQLDDFKKVIDHKFKEWYGTDWQEHLHPETLFQPSKFIKYLESAKDHEYREQGLTEKVRMALANPNRLPFLKLNDDEMREFEKRAKNK